VARVVTAHGVTVLGRKGLMQLPKFIEGRDFSDTTSRSVALEAIANACISLDKGIPAIHKVNTLQFTTLAALQLLL
jgi:hypothetical protein